MKYVTFTRRTEDPKLAHLERLLADAGIPSRRAGRSFHAPILEVPEDQLDAAWRILDPIDDTPDDDPQFVESEQDDAWDEWCEEGEAPIGNTILWSNRRKS